MSGPTFIRLTTVNGDDVLLRVDSIEMVAIRQDGGSHIFLVGGEAGQDLPVNQSLDEIHAALVGVKPETLKAYPHAIGWVQHPELNVPAPWAPKAGRPS